MRSKIEELLIGDVFQENPLGAKRQYPLVLSCYCVECASPSIDVWKDNMRHLMSLVSKNGRLILVALINASSYRISKDSVTDTHFPSVPISETDVEILLKKEGFVGLDIRVGSEVGWKEEGFDSIILATGIKSSHI